MKKLIKQIASSLGYEIRRSPKKSVRNIFQGVFDASNFQKINYGYGTAPMKEWLNVDLQPVKKEGFATLCVDLISPHPFADHSFQWGFCEDFIEHLSQAQSLIFLSEVYRTFKPGGILRISTPGMSGVLKKFYLKREYQDMINGNKEIYDQWQHLHFYSEDELSLVCRHLGFRQIEFVQFRQSAHSELKNLDTRDQQITFNLYAEITK